MSTKNLTAVRHARHRVFSCSVSCFLLHVFSLSFRQREAAGLIGKKWRLLVPEKTATVLRASGPDYKRPVVDVWLLLRRGLVNQIGLAVLAVY